MPPFRPTQAEVNRFAEKNTGMAMSSLKDPQSGGPINRVPEAGGVAANNKFRQHHPNYPDYVYPDDRQRDTYYNTLYQLERLNQGDGEKGFVSHLVGPGEIQYWQDKRNAQEAALFKAFVEDSLPRGTPWARDFFERIMPG